MKFAIILVLSMILANPASSNPSPEWFYITSSEADDTYFVHEPSLIAEEGRIEFWQLINYTKAQKKPIDSPYLSAKSLSVMDCSKRVNIIKEVVFYSKVDGEGKVLSRVSSEFEGQWKTSVMPGSVTESVFRVVCGKTTKNAKSTQSIAEQVAKAKNTNPILVHWENNDPVAWDEALRQDEILRAHPQWAEKSYDARFAEVVRRVRAIMPEASAP